MDEFGFDEALELATLSRQVAGYRVPERMTDYTVTWYCDDARTWKERAVWQLSALHFSKDDRGTWDALSIIARWHLRSRVPMMPELGEWIADRREGNRRRPSKRGRSPETVRDTVMASTVQAIVDRGLKATRNKRVPMKSDPRLSSKEGGSACDAVGVAFGLNYKAIERVWNKSSQSKRQSLRPSLALLAHSGKK